MELEVANIRRLVALKFDLKQTELTEQTRFVEDLGADSLSKLELVMLMEEQFGLEIGDAEAEEILSIGDAEAYVQKMLAER
jgi:acyl carrier protein